MHVFGKITANMFSFHEMGLYDIPAFIDLIRSKSKSSEKVILLGHSMGTSISYIYASIRRDHADKHLKAIISVAPIAYMRNFRTSVKPIALFTYQIDVLIFTNIFFKSTFKINFSTLPE